VSAHFARRGRARVDDLRPAEVGTSDQRNHARGRDGRCGSPRYPLLVRARLSVDRSDDRTSLRRSKVFPSLGSDAGEHSQVAMEHRSTPHRASAAYFSSNADDEGRDSSPTREISFRRASRRHPMPAPYVGWVAPYGLGPIRVTGFGGAGFLRAPRCPAQLQNFWRAGARIGVFNLLRSFRCARSVQRFSDASR
jgi:hypothetical protein